MAKESGICPECGNTTEHDYRPFCSKRCANLDLSRWLRGSYAIAGGNSDADEDGDDSAATELARLAQKDDSDGNPDRNLH